MQSNNGFSLNRRLRARLRETMAQANDEELAPVGLAEILPVLAMLIGR